GPYLSATKGFPSSPPICRGWRTSRAEPPPSRQASGDLSSLASRGRRFSSCRVLCCERTSSDSSEESACTNASARILRCVRLQQARLRDSPVIHDGLMILLKLTDVFRRLQVSPATGYRLIRDGVIPVVVLSRGSRRRLLRVCEEDLERTL